MRRVRLHNDYVTSAGIPQRSSGRLTLHAGNAEDRAVLLAQRGNATCAALGIDRILLSVDYPYGRSNAPVCQAGGGSSTRSNTRPLEPSPRPIGDSRPIRTRARSVWTRDRFQAVRFVVMHDVDRLVIAEQLDRWAIHVPSREMSSPRSSGRGGSRA